MFVYFLLLPRWGVILAVFSLVICFLACIGVRRVYSSRVVRVVRLNGDIRGRSVFVRASSFSSVVVLSFVLHCITARRLLRLAAESCRAGLWFRELVVLYRPGYPPCTCEFFTVLLGGIAVHVDL